MNTTGEFRSERDLLGEKKIPANAYYGVQTARAMENFHISGVPISQYPDLIRGLAVIKLAAARANVDCGVFDKKILDGIERACRELMDGKLHDEFQVDLLQGGAGTSTNMAANEVIANRALELMGHKKGEYQFCDPHDHVNCAQSTNDAYPSALHVAMVFMNGRLIGRDGSVGGGAQRERQGVCENRKDGSHTIAGCGPHDGWPGVQRVVKESQ